MDVSGDDSTYFAFRPCCSFSFLSQDSFNSGRSGDQVEQLKSQVNDVKGIMQDNINKALDRGARLDDLVDQTENLESQVSCYSESMCFDMMNRCTYPD